MTSTVCVHACDLAGIHTQRLVSATKTCELRRRSESLISQFHVGSCESNLAPVVEHNMLCVPDDSKTLIQM